MNESCGICAGKMIYIRGRYPGTDNRLVCPTCLAERMDQIREIASPDYGIAFEIPKSNLEFKKLKGEGVSNIVCTHGDLTALRSLYGCYICKVEILEARLAIAKEALEQCANYMGDPESSPYMRHLAQKALSKLNEEGEK